MSLQTYQKNIYDYIVSCYKKYFPQKGKIDGFYSDSMFEVTYTFNLAVAGIAEKKFPIQIYILMKLFERGTDLAGKPLYSIAAKMGFRVPYKKECWTGSQTTLLFDINPDPIYDGFLNFSYHGCCGNRTDSDGDIRLGPNIGETVEQFCADVECNLNGSYQIHIREYNGYRF